jgi:hypothetical protein
MQYEHSYNQAGESGHCEQSPAMSLRERTEQGEVHPVDGETEADHGKAGENSNEYRENEEEYFFMEGAFERGKQAPGNTEAHE